MKYRAQLINDESINNSKINPQTYNDKINLLKILSYAITNLIIQFFVVELQYWGG